MKTLKNLILSACLVLVTCPSVQAGQIGTTPWGTPIVQGTNPYTGVTHTGAYGPNGGAGHVWTGPNGGHGGGVVTPSGAARGWHGPNGAAGGAIVTPGGVAWGVKGPNGGAVGVVATPGGVRVVHRPPTN